MSFAKKISLEIYDVNKITQAIDQFEDVVSIRLIDWNIIIEWLETNEEYNEMFSEFMNYVLAS